MAIFYMEITSISRGAGRRATASAAYRSGERLRDERSGRVHNFSHRRDVLHTEILVPQQFADQPLEWARNRERLWNTAEQAEKRYNARVAREYQVTLPPELNPVQRIALARTFSRELAERYGVAVDLAVHEPRAGGDPRNFHAHILTTTRAVTPTGLGAKAGLDLQGLERRRRGLPDHRAEYVNLRARWAQLTNSALREVGINARVDHRSLAAQGIDREPLPRIPNGAVQMERRGLRSDAGEYLRAQYQERVQQRLALARERETQQATGQPAPAEVRGGLKEAIPGTHLEQVRRQARASWLALRAAERSTEKGPGPGQEQEVSVPARHPQDDLAR